MKTFIVAMFCFAGLASTQAQYYNELFFLPSKNNSVSLHFIGKHVYNISENYVLDFYNQDYNYSYVFVEHQPFASVKINDHLYFSDYSNRDVKLVKVNSSGDPVWAKTHTIDSGYITSSCLAKNEEDIFLSVSLNTIDQSHLRVYKLDTLGDKIWESTIKTHEAVVLDQIIISNNGNIFLSSKARENGTYYGRFWELNNLGKLNWSLESTEIIEKVQYPFIRDVYAAELSTGEYLIAYNTRPDELSHESQYRLQWISQSGTLRQEKLLNNTSIANKLEVYSITKGKGDYFFLVGTGEKSNDDSYGIVIKMDNHGTLIWTGYYQKNFGTDMQDDMRLASLIELENGDLIMGGDVSLDDELHFLWLIKTDSLGCEMPYECDNIVSSFEENLSVNNRTLLYPNPCKDFLNIENPKAHFFEIYNGSGLKVKSGIAENMINLQSLHAGLYYFKLMNEENTMIESKIIQKI